MMSTFSIPVVLMSTFSIQAVMMRSSQPMVGQTNSRCKEDEQLLNCVLGQGRRGYIVDTRSLSVARMAQSKGSRLLTAVLTF